MPRRIVPWMLLALAALPACAGGSPSSRPSAPAPGSFTLTDVAWLAGSWRRVDGDSSEEEHWLAPAGGLMLGLNRSVEGSRASFEYLAIRESAEGVLYLASPGGRPPTPFTLVEAKPGRMVFSNPEHDFPKRIIYSLSGDDLVARIEGDGGKGMEWAWQRGTFLPE